MTFNTFSSGVNTSFSSQLNENFDMLSEQAAAQYSMINWFVPGTDSYAMQGNSASVLITGLLNSVTNMSSGECVSSGAFSADTYPFGIPTTTEAYVGFNYTVFTKGDETGVSSSATNNTDADTSSYALTTGMYAFTWAITNNTNANTHSGTISITDGSVTVTLMTYSGGGSYDISPSGQSLLFLDKTNKRAILYNFVTVYNGDETVRTQETTAVSLSTLGSGSYYLKTSASSNAAGATSTAAVSKIRKVKVGTPASTVNLKVSLDGGSNYTTLSKRMDYIAPANTGSLLVFKMDGTCDANEVIVWQNVQFRCVA